MGHVDHGKTSCWDAIRQARRGRRTKRAESRTIERVQVQVNKTGSVVFIDYGRAIESVHPHARAGREGDRHCVVVVAAATA